MKLLVLLASLAFGQQMQSVDDFSGGLNTSLSSLQIKDNESPALENVILDRVNGITRRQGFRKLNSSAIGGGVQDTNAVYQLDKSNGNRYCVAFSSTTGYYSTDACQTFTAFVSTLTLNLDVNCDPINDKLYCVNGQYNFKFDGANDSSFTSDPAALKYIRVNRNICFGAGNSTNPSRLYWSGTGNCDSWTTSTDYVDISPNDGDVITGIGEPLYDMLPVYKKFSSWVIKGTNPQAFTLVNVSKNTGAVNHRSIRNLNNVQLFDSLGPNGGRPGIYGFNGILVAEASRKLRNEIDFLDTFKANAGRHLVDSKQDFDLGTFDTRAMSSNRDTGFMQSSNTAFGDDDPDDIVQGTLVQVSSIPNTGYITLDLATDFSTYTILPLAASTWTIAASVTSCGATSANWTGSPPLSIGLGANYCAAISTPLTLSTGSWTVNIGMSAFASGDNTSSFAYFKFISNGTDLFYSNGYIAGVQRVSASQISTFLLKTGPTGQSLLCSAQTSSSATSFTIAVSRTRAGAFVLKNGATTICSVTDTAYTLSTNMVLAARTGLVNTKTYSFTVIGYPGYYASGSVVSLAFDTAISTPIWGLFTVGISSPTDTALTFQTQVATSASGAWDSLTSATLNAKIASASKRYLRYKANFSTSNSSKTATFDWFASSASSTGTWTSNEMYLSVNMTSWGLFQCAQTTTGDSASLAYSIRASTYSGGTAYASWTSQTCNTLITISTGAYFQVVSTATISVATETAKIDVLSISWNEGTQARSASAAVYGGRYHYGVQSQNGLRNDVLYVLDSNQAWTKWTGLRPRFLNVVNEQFVMGDSMANSTYTESGFIYKLYETDSDDGAAISAFWESKDFSLGPIQNIKAPTNLYVIYNSSATTINAQLKVDGGLKSQTFSVNLSTATAFGLKSFSVNPPINGNTARVRFYNNAASAPWEILGFGIRFREIGVTAP